MKILVTGGAGYIGSHMVKALCNQNHNVIVLDSLINGHKKAVDKRAKFIQGCLSSKETVIKALNGCDAVMHFAGFIEAGISMKEPAKFFENNCFFGINLLEAMKETKTKYIIFSSSTAIYGNPKYIPIDEQHKKEPVNFYGQSKLFFEQLLQWYDKLYRIKSISLRYFNASGADESGEIGEAHNPETHLIPLILKTALDQRNFIEIFGTDYNTEDGTCIRDYIHINDLCSAHLLALEYLMKNKKTDYFNLGTGKGNSVKEIISSCKKITNKEIKTIKGKKRIGDPPTLVASLEKAKKVLGWKPKYTNIDSIIKTAWNWHKNNPKGYQKE